MSEIPYKLSRFIEKCQGAAMDENNGDHKPTYRGQLDAIADGCQRLYAVGEQFIATLGPVDLARCRALYKLKHGNTYGVDDLVDIRIGKHSMIIPTYIALVEEMRALVEVLDIEAKRSAH